MAEQQAGAGIPPDLRERAQRVLTQLALISEGRATTWQPGHEQPDSRPPVEDVHRGDRPPPKALSLHDHWRWKLESARDRRQFLLYLLNAEEDLVRAHKTPPPMPELGEAKTERICQHADDGLSAEEVAVREHVNIAHVQHVWQQDHRDPVTGQKLPQDREELYAYARELAREDGMTQAAIARRTGLPRVSLQRHLPG